MTTCCFVFVPGILENQDSEFLAWVLVSTYGNMQGGPGGGRLGRILESDWGTSQDPI